ncbi:C-type mannose receptor 2-like [Leguminivora glycinivorella]|uniref:C-type mannose receptor 2-like n=1 Tax=Leguminivora glycinivorella TaxID=1035111 RepID=UPI00200F6379|nr:C-type mannose receptor 2-like [Leguminivora glycinivorella]
MKMNVFVCFVLVLFVQCVFSIDEDLHEKLPYEKPTTLKRVIRAPEGILRASTGNVDLLMSMGNEEPEPLPLNLSPGQEYIYYDAANGSMKLHRTPASWSEARLKCFDEGAELASPENEALLYSMSRVLLTSRQPVLQVFTGVNDLLSRGYFTSLKGVPLKKMAAAWAPREPNNLNHFGNCLIMQRSGPLFDSKCDDMYPYICYKRDPPSQMALCGTTDTEYVYNKLTKTCHKIHPQFVSWQAAYAMCDREGSYLAIVNSEYEARTLARMIKTEWIWAHLGFSYWREGLWVTVHGETITEAGYDEWAPGEPNDANVERCGCIAADIPKFVDIDCLDHARPFICERSGSM